MKDKKWAFIFPGQGAQYPGMGKDFHDIFPVARHLFEEADDCLNIPFSRLIFEGPLEELTLTKNSQIAIYITSMAVLKTVQHEFPELIPTVCAGLSLGEYTALTASGRTSFRECLEIVRLRALYMHEACEQHPGTMQVVLGLEFPQVEEAIDGLPGVWLANLNCPGQVVIAGTHEGLCAAAGLLKAKGAKRVLPLDVSGALHSGLMRSAQELLSANIQALPLHPSEIQLVMNVPGDFVKEIDQIKQHLIAQVASPVRWEQGIRAITEQGIDGCIEMGPGKTLAGMNKRIGVTQPTLSIEKVADLKSLSESLEFYATVKR